MSDCKTVRLGDVCEIITGGTPSTTKKEYWANGTIPWLQSGVCQNCFVNKTETFITQEGLDNSSAKLMPKDTVLIALTGATTGKVGYLTFEACANQSVTGILPSKSFNQLYLYYCLLSKREKILSDSYGGAQKHISQGYVKNLEVQMPNIDKQNEIATILDEISNIITKHKLILEKYDTLIKSRFIEMFGDNPIENGKWKVEKLGNLGLCKNGMNFSYENNGFEINCLGVGDFKDNAVISNCEKLPVISLNEKPSEEYLLKDNDIVFVRSNGNKELVGRSVLVHPRVLTTFSGFCIRFRLSTDSINHLFLLQFLKMPNTRKNMAGRGANIQNLNQQILSNLDIPVPQIELQNDFSSFVQQIDKSKFEYAYMGVAA